MSTRAKAAETLVPLGQGISLLSAPLYHVIGEMDGMMPMLITGKTLIVMPRVVLDAMFDHIQRYNVTRMFAVPAMYRMILEHDRLDYYGFRSLRYCGTGGDAMPVEVGNRWLKRFRIPLFQGYGATELCGAISLAYAKDGIPPEGSAGKIVPGDKFKLVDPHTLQEVPPGEPGELLGTCEFAVKEYWNKPEETAESIRDSISTKDMNRLKSDKKLTKERRKLFRIENLNFTGLQSRFHNLIHS